MAKIKIEKSKIFNFFYFALYLVTLIGCNNPDTFSIIKVTELGGAKISDSTLVIVLENEKQIELDLSYSSKSDETMKMIINREIDLAILPNNSRLMLGAKNIRTVAPMLPRAMMIFYKTEYKPSIPELFNNSKVTYELTGVSDSIFYSNFLDHYGVDIKSFNYFLFDGNQPYEKIKQQLDSTDIWISISHIRNYLIDSLFAYGFELYSLDDSYPGNSVDGYAMKHPQSHPMILPKYLFNGKPEIPIQTLSVNDVLVAHKDFSESVVYDIIEVLTEKRNLLLQYDRNYNLLPTLDDELNHLSFPLHQGTLNYMNREKPTFLERYAEVMALIFSFLVLGGGYTIEKIQDIRLIQQKRKKLKDENGER